LLIAGAALCGVFAAQCGLAGTTSIGWSGSVPLATTAATMLFTAFNEELVLRGLLLSGLLRLLHSLDHGPDWLTDGHYGPEAGVIGILSRFVVMPR